MPKDKYWLRPFGDHMHVLQQTGGSVEALALHGSTLALACGVHLELYDVSNPDRPVYLGASDMLTLDPQMDSMCAVALGPRCAVVSLRFGEVVVDVTDPRHPRYCGDLALNDHSYDPSMVLVGDLLFVGADNDLQVWSLKEPASPVRLRRQRSHNQARLATDDTYLYVWEGNVLHVLDLDSPTRLTELSRCACLFAESWVEAMAAANGRVYLGVDDGIQVLDCRDPRRPALAGFVHVPTAPHGLAANGNLAFVGAEDYGAYILDASDPARPGIVAHLHDAGLVMGLVGTATHLYVADRDANGLKHTRYMPDPTPPQPIRVIDVHDPARPVAVQTSTSFQYAHRLAVTQDAVYVIDHHNAYAGLRTLSLTDPSKPAGWLGLEYRPVALHAEGTRAVVATERELQIADCSDREAPRRIGACVPSAGPIRDLAIADDRAYVLTPQHLHAISLSPSNRPREVDLLVLPGPCRSLAVVDGYVYVAAGKTISVVRLARGHKQHTPHWRGQHGRIRKLAGQRGLLVAAGRRGVTFLSLEDPSSPYEVGFWKDPLGYGPLVLTFVEGGGLFYARWDEMFLLDIRSPAHPVVVDHWPTDEQRWYVKDAATQGTRCYVAAADDGLLVLDLSLPADDKGGAARGAAEEAAARTDDS